MSKLKKTPIKYTSRDFDSIKKDLVDHAKRYYGETWKDFSKSTINSLMIDSVAYVGDVLSYYLDYQVNEGFLDTAIEFSNIRKHARALGYKYSGIPSSYGTVQLFCIVPSNAAGSAPAREYMPTIKKGTVVESVSGTTFTLTEDVLFSDPKNLIVAARQDSTTGATTHFAVKAQGQVVSGLFQRSTVDLTNSNFKKFRRIRVGDSNISEIISVKDSDGNDYYEVENLAQEVIFKETVNTTAQSDGVRNILKPFIATRRFVFEQDDTGSYLQFGFGSDTDELDGLADPSLVVLQMHGKDSMSDLSFDPTKLLGTTKLGIVPSLTTLTIITKINTVDSVNAGSNTLTSFGTVISEFPNQSSLNGSLVSSVKASLEVTNEEPILGDSNEITRQELKVRAKTYYATQNRAVTKQDYESMIYNMPKKFGVIKRASVVSDPSGTNRRLAVYLMSENSDGSLITANSRIKENVKNWIMQYKSLNDVIDIYDAKIINFGIDFKIVVDERFAKFNIVGRCVERLNEYFSNKLYIGEPIYITRLYGILGKVEGVADVKKVDVYQKFGGSYSSIRVNFDETRSKDGSFIKTPKNVIMELKFPSRDIKGTLLR